MRGSSGSAGPGARSRVVRAHRAKLFFFLLYFSHFFFTVDTSASCICIVDLCRPSSLSMGASFRPIFTAFECECSFFL
ncbi:hypothetical protein OF83DRAFT_1160162 [Amylostereum chailletii]|nr:hypothetical protein OF83DRAFT_1160162 [Amylostereum chailletii]